MAVNVGQMDPFGPVRAIIPTNKGIRAAAGKATGGFVKETDNRSVIRGIHSAADTFDALTDYHDHEYAGHIEKKILEERYSPGAVLGEIEEEGLTFKTRVSKRRFTDILQTACWA